MIVAMYRKLSAPSLIVLLSLLSACVAPPTKERPAPSASELAQQAQKAEESGDFVAAARAYTVLAESASMLKKGEYQLLAAEMMVRGNHIPQAKQILQGIDIKMLHADQLIRRQLISARIALAENDLAGALDILRVEFTPSTPAELQAQVHELRAIAYERSGNLLASARERSMRGAFLDSADHIAIVENQQQLWQTLMRMSDTALSEPKLAPPPDTFSGWLELAHIAKSAQLEPLAMGDRIAIWRKRYPEHPAVDEILNLLIARQQEEIHRPGNIALLLPQSGGLTPVADALRDGFMAAHYFRRNRDYNPVIRIYDVSTDPENAVDSYNQAVQNGAEFVVGPLRKESVNALLRSGHISVPTLTLNYAEDVSVSDPNLYQFGLAPEDEARQVAERAWLEGNNQALVLVPDGEWGERVLAVFRHEWENLGGKVLESQSYSPNDNDFSAPIRALLNLDESEQRFKVLQSFVRERLQFEPRRRQDGDFVFMAAFPRQARLLKPQLKFHYASTLPVYSTSHVFTGKVDRHADRDMDDVIFCDMPWLLDPDEALPELKHKISALWPDTGDQYTRFYAMGIDAYNLIPNLRNMRLFDYERFNGTTGTLQLTRSNRIFRELRWARISNGAPRSY
jgi:outer membrane PBP1 activator LpoA protein